MKEGSILLAREVITRGFTHKQPAFTLRSDNKDKRLVVLYLGEVDADSLPHFRAEGMLAALGFHQFPKELLPEHQRNDAARWQFVQACMADPEGLAAQAADEITDEIGMMPEDLSGQASIDWMNHATDLALTRLNEKLVALEAGAPAKESKDATVQG